MISGMRYKKSITLQERGFRSCGRTVRRTRNFCRSRSISTSRKGSSHKEFDQQEEEESPSMSSPFRSWMTGSMLNTAWDIRWIRQMYWMSG